MEKHDYDLTDITGTLTFEYLPSVNYSMHHNHFPALLRCSLANKSGEMWQNIYVDIAGEMLVGSSAHIDSLAAGTAADLTKTLVIDIDPGLLMQLSEGVTSSFSVKVTVDGTEVLNRDLPLTLMAYDQWPGLGIRPELLASFVTPNHPLLSRVATNAAAFLNQWTGNPSLDEYQQQDPNRVRAQVAAVYEALRSEAIVYATPPASFEEKGQRLRTPDRVLTEKLGTCIDLSLLMASCLESIGINPILVLVKGHCLVGAWLVRDAYPKPVGDDPTFLTKSAAHGINEIVLVEATDITGAEAVDFETAVADGMAHLRNAADFICFIDVYRARVGDIRPLPLRVKEGDHWTVQNTGVEHDNATTAVRHIDRYDLTEYSGDGRTVSKFTIWERKLLDFSLRNNLLNMRLGKRIIPLVSFAIDRLEDDLQGGNSFRIDPFPLNEAPLRTDQGMYDSAAYPQLAEYCARQLANHRVNSYLDADDLREATKYVYRASRTSLEENGANNLYLVIGVLKWYETDNSRQPRFAPVLLIPAEMVRATGGAGYTVRARDEETVLNITLAQLLSQQYDIDLSALDNLPKDESGVDVPRIFAFIRDRIRSKHGWDLLEESMIGLFSFSKFVMWNDIHTNSEWLLQNDIISSLVEGRLKIEDTDLDSDAKVADRELMPDRLLTPIDVDSSQLEAVMASGAGKSFILHGPPGTGKSQTITNMIANALYQGKRVLFVAEKMAALEVVQGRLEKIGLAPFCLELHSNKVTKQHFLRQMDAALNVSRQASPDAYLREADNLYEKRIELLSYIEALHGPTPYGLSLYDCIMRYLSIDGDEIPADIDAFPALDSSTVASLTEDIRYLDTIFRLTGRPEENPLRDLDITDGSAQAEQTLADPGGRLRLCRPERPACLPDDPALDSADGMYWESGYMEYALAQPWFGPGLIDLAADGTLMRTVTSAIKAGENAENLRKSLTETYTEAVHDIDVDRLEDEWRQINGKWFVARYLGKRSLLGRMAAYRPGFGESDVNSIITSRRRLKELESEYVNGSIAVQAVFGDLAYPGSEQWQTMTSAIGCVQPLRGIISVYATMAGVDTPEAARRLRQAMPANFHALLTRDRNRYETFVKDSRTFLDSVETIGRIARSNIPAEGWGEAMQEALQRWHDNAALFKNWYLWCREQRRLAEAGLTPVLEYLAVSHASGAQAALAFAKGLYHAMANRIINGNDRLRFFNGALLDDTIDRYRRLTARFQQLGKQELFCRLAANIPSQQMAAHESSEIGILKRNIRNGGRGTSIRRIIDQIPTLLPKLSPCMLMSPMSVAQYIDLKNDKFDIVIFDEASQMPTSEAVGAIARGKALVVVGDPRQMPPTNFFSTSAVGEDEAWIDDMESILDDCISLSMPAKHLLWHYRSRHESLISFSNEQYYDGKLFTFPSTDDRVSKVTLRHIDGVYDKGRTRSNIPEAQAVVDEVMRRLADPELSRLSIGIVSFSKVQQDKIEDLLNDTLARNPDLEAIALGSREPIFVKNLENVQGDERDVILFSVGYGPDKDGRVSMNFGPLNNVGGERRLNVAVSRARHEMVVFSSLRPEQIDLRRTNAPGVVGLKRFLEFAESGSSPVPAGQSQGAVTDHIAATLAAFLRLHGYETKAGVGRSKFKVDLAVVHPDRPDEFILAILCDGPGYYETKTVRDREIVQPSVLGQLNWHTMRVWTLDWFERRDQVQRAVLDRLERLRSNPDIDDSPVRIPDLDQEFKAAATPAAPQPAAPSSPHKASKYLFADLQARAPVANADALASHTAALRKQIIKVIEVEQPVTDSLLYKRIVKAWGLNRVSPRLQSIVDTLLGQMPVHATDNDGGGRVLWLSERDADCFTGYRVDSERDIHDVPAVEVRNAMLYTLSQQVAITVDDLRRLTAQQLGFNRLGANIDAVTSLALSTLADEGRIILQGGKAIIR